MSGYRRFAAYVYEYRNERKAENVGFIKVEVRDQICTMDMSLHSESIRKDDTGKVYGFVRNQGLMDGILLGTCTAQSGVLRGSFTVRAENMEESGIAVTALGGMIIQTEAGGFYGTEWDDEPIRPRNFRERRIEKKEPVQTENIQGSVRETMHAMDEANLLADMKAGTLEDGEKLETAEHGDSIGKPEIAENVEAIEKMEFMAETESTDDETSTEKMETSDHMRVTETAAPRADLKDPENVEALSHMASEENSSAAEIKKTEIWIPEDSLEIPEEDVQMTGSCECQTKEEKSQKSDKELYQTLYRKPCPPPTPGSNSDFRKPGRPPYPDSVRPSQPNRPGRPPYPSRPIPGETDCPFADCDTLECRRVTPQELCHFSRNLCGLRNNRFLQQGYRNFGHILLCMRENGQYILGVPGRYNQQERYSAEMFGFPFFKESKKLPVYGCKGGYWYRIVNIRDIK